MYNIIHFELLENIIKHIIITFIIDLSFLLTKNHTKYSTLI